MPCLKKKTARRGVVQHLVFRKASTIKRNVVQGECCSKKKGEDDVDTNEKSKEAPKNPGWYTAFYRYAEYLRLLTQGALNHKTLYAYIGLNARYVNNQNPLLRKRSAGGLSRLLHSSRYAADFQESLRKDPDIFQKAAGNLALDLLRTTEYDQAQLVAMLLKEGCDHVRAGLLAEIPLGRIDVSIARFDGDRELLRTWACEQVVCDADVCLQTVLCSLFYFMAFGHLEEHFANELVDASPTDILASESNSEVDVSLRACVLRAVDNSPASIENMWVIGAEESFLIGRYVDCDAVEVDGLISRKHCRIFRKQGIWYIYDEGSRYGTAVHRDGQVVWDSKAKTNSGKRSDMPECFPLTFGDCLVLAGRIHYWFVSLQNVERLLIIG